MKKFLSIVVIVILIINFVSPIIFAVDEMENNSTIVKKQTDENTLKNSDVDNDKESDPLSLIEEENNENETKETETYTVPQNNVNEKTQARIHIDEPTSNYIEGKNASVIGWFLCSDSKAILKVYIDGKDINAEVTRVEREDVLKAIPGYGGREINPKPGFIAKLDLSNTRYGKHTIKYAVVDEKGTEIQKIEKTVTIDNRTKARMQIDEPTSNYIEGKNASIIGWFLCSDSKATLKVYIDGKDINAEVTRVEREDVLKAIPGYGGRGINPKPGFIAKLDLSNTAYGKHIIKYVVVDEKGIELQKIEKTVTIDSRTKAKMDIDKPTKNLTEGDTFITEGWYITNDINSQFKILIDNTEVQLELTRKEREDVLKAVPGYGGRELNPKPGFIAKINIKNFERKKEHTIKYVIYDQKGNEIVSKIKKIIFYSDDKGKMCLDYPTGIATSGNNVTYNGWVMSQTAGYTIKVYLNGKEISPDIQRIEREDVLRAISGYGGREINPKPGFEFTLSTKEFNQGDYIVDIKLISSEGKEMASNRNIIRVARNFGIDIYSGTGNIDWSQTKNFINYAILRIGWVGDTRSSIDSLFNANYSSCIRNGIPVGVYVYNYATSVERARYEAYQVIDWLKGKELRLPVFFDIEEDEVSKVECRELNTEMTKAFCSIIEENGYQAGIYANTNFLTNYIDMSQIGNKYNVWVAQYYHECTYKGRYDIWQYSSAGRLPGINKNVDCNYFYKNY